MTGKAAASLLLSNDGFLILTHLNPDGDTIGSASALCSALRRSGKTAYLYSNPQISDIYRSFIPGDYFAPDDYSPDYIIAVDIADIQLFPMNFSGRVDFCVDHHPSNRHYAKNLLLDANRSSCGEIVYKLILSMGIELNEAEATFLYMALSTDTGCFKYKNTNSASFLAASKYAAAGADVFKVNKLFFNTKTSRRISLEGIVYSGIEYAYSGRFAVGSVSLADIASSGAEESDLDNLAGLVSCISGTEITALIRETQPGICKVSLRSDIMDCSEICCNFGGGGHRAAAGFTIHSAPAQTKAVLIDVLEGYMK